MKKTVLLALGVAFGSAGAGFGTGMYYDGAKQSEMSMSADAASAENSNQAAQLEPVVVDVGRVLVPVQQPRSIKYVVANVAIATTSESEISFLQSVEGATKIRNEILTTMFELAETSVLGGDSINTEHLSQLVKIGISEEFGGIDGVLFNNLTVTDMGRG